MTVLDDRITDTVVMPSTEPAPSLDSSGQVLLKKLKSQLAKARKANREKYEYYETKQRVRQLDIAIPPMLRDVFTVCGWPATVVDTLEERIDLMGYTSSSGDLMGLDEVFIDNNMDLESSRGTVDDLIAGTAFVSVGTGDPGSGEPDVVVRAESPNSATVVWDYRKNSAAAGLSVTYDEANRLVMQSLYLPNKTVLYAANPLNGKLEIVNVDNHNVGRVLMSRLVSKDRASNPHGRSEITRPVRYYTDAAIRTMLGMEVNREFYTTPMRALLDVDPATMGFTEDMSEAEKIRRGWSIMMGHLNLVPPQGGDGPMSQARPQAVEFRAQPPTPYIEQIKGYSIMLSGECGLPATAFGFVTDNPTSGDAITKSEYRLVRRAERRIQGFNPTWREVALLILLCKGRRDLTMSDMRAIRPLWRNPAVPTRAAQADEAQKLVVAKILPPNSEVTYRRLDFTEQDQITLERDWRKQEAKDEAAAARESARTLNTAVATTKAKAAAAPASATPGRPNVGGGPSA